MESEMTTVLEQCELCGKEQSATYTGLMSILGAALCPACVNISKTQSFRKELSHLLATGEGDLEKFVRVYKMDLCRVCGVELKTSNWAKSNQSSNRHICISCSNQKKVTTPENSIEKHASEDIHKIPTPHDMVCLYGSMGSIPTRGV